MPAVHLAAASPDEPPRTTKITHSDVVVDPDTACRWLEANTHNRRLKQARVTAFAADMRAGRWLYNGDPIRFDVQGRLLDGQHRLWAIVESSTTQLMHVIRNLPAETQQTMDQGGRRTPADQLTLAGFDADNSTAGAIKIYLAWTTGRLFGDVIALKPSTPELVEWAERNPEKFARLAEFNAMGYRRIPVRPSIGLAVALRFHEVDPDFARDFFARLITGAGLTTTSPLLALRNRLQRIKDTKTNEPERDLLGFFIVAWNAERDGRPMGKLQRPHGGSWTAETFPEPK